MAEVVDILRERFDSEVEIRELRVLIFPQVYVAASGVVLRYEGRTDIPPFLVADEMTVTARLQSLFETPRKITSVRMSGLQIHVPPRAHRSQESTQAQSSSPSSKRGLTLSVAIDKITAQDAILVMLSSDPNKVPLEFDIHDLELDDAGTGHAAHFRALLRNPKPVGDIETLGIFGPWQPDKPSLTPIHGDYSFSNADLSTLKGISGILSSSGHYSGVLDDIEVEGDTDTPNFALRLGGKPVDLKTHFVADVDGTNGDTHLKNISAKFLHSTVQTGGEVVSVRGENHRHILLDATARDARIEDLLHLVMKGEQPVMTGAAHLNCKIDLPPQAGDLFDRLVLAGRFGVSGGHFSSPGIQEKIDSLSRHAQGEPKNLAIEDVVSDLQGQFSLKNKLATFSDLGFDVSGAKVQLAGTYNLEDETLDFRGHLLLKAKLSQLMTGAGSILLKPFDSLFQKNGAGTSLPIRISGTRAEPAFGLDFQRNDKSN